MNKIEQTKNTFTRKHTNKKIQKFLTDEKIMSFRREFYLRRYNWTREEFKHFMKKQTKILEAGCGVGDTVKWFAENTDGEVIGVDYSDSIKDARENLKDYSNVVLLQEDITNLPFNKQSFSFINCDMVIHHTANPEKTFRHLLGLLKPGGTLVFYVYKKKAVMREFADDYIRKHTVNASEEDSLKVCEQITKLGKALSDLKAEVDIPCDIPLLGIKKGKLDVQRFIYWNFLNCFWNNDRGFESCVMANFDWYRPALAYRYTPEEIKEWMEKVKDIVEILSFDVCDSGISVRCKKK